MGTFFLDISVSLDGYVAGPNQTLDDPLGAGGNLLHEWVIAAKAWREAHGLEGGEEGVDSDVVRETVADVGATIMGRRMFSGGEGPWENDPNANAWWGDDPPFHNPVFVVTNHAREPLPMQGGTTFHFITDGIEAALEQAKQAAGDKRIQLSGGAKVAQQYLRAKQLDEVQLHVVPVFLGAGERLFDDHVADPPAQLERMSAAESPTGVTHLKYRVVK